MESRDFICTSVPLENTDLLGITYINPKQMPTNELYIRDRIPIFHPIHITYRGQLILLSVVARHSIPLPDAPIAA